MEYFTEPKKSPRLPKCRNPHVELCETVVYDPGPACHLFNLLAASTRRLSKNMLRLATETSAELGSSPPYFDGELIGARSCLPRGLSTGLHGGWILDPRCAGDDPPKEAVQLTMCAMEAAARRP